MLGGFSSFPRKAYEHPKKSKLGVIIKQKSKPTKKRSRLGAQRRYPSSTPASPPPSVISGPRTGIAIIGNFKKWPWGQHPDEAYLADAIQTLGVPVHRIQQQWIQSSVLDVAWVIFTGQPESWQKIHKWGKKNRTILWTLDWIPDYPERKEILSAARRADVFVSSDQFDWKKNYGLGNHFYLPGACESIPVKFDPHPTRTCAFMGGLYNSRRSEIARIVRKYDGEVLYAPGTWVYAQRLAEYVQSTKVIIGDNARNDVPGYWSTRNYVVPGAGGFLLTSNVPGLEKDLEVGKHIAVYEEIGALEEALKICLEQNEERELVRKQGFEHVRKNHSWINRARTLLEHLQVPCGQS